MAAPTLATLRDAAGALIRTARRQPLLSAEEERRLLCAATAGDGAAEARLVGSHLRLVVAQARRFAAAGVPLADLVQEGTLGLLQAVRKFNPEANARLSTYAAWWVRAAMQEYVVRSWSVVRPGKTAPHRALFFALRGRFAAATELGEDAAAALAARFRLPLAEVTGLAARLRGRDLSLDVPLDPNDPEGEESWRDRLAAPGPSPEAATAARLLMRRWRDRLDSALAALPGPEATVIRLRHLAEDPPSFEAIGRQLGLSKERVRQIERQALARLREALGGQREAFGFPGPR